MSGGSGSGAGALVAAPAARSAHLRCAPPVGREETAGPPYLSGGCWEGSSSGGRGTPIPAGRCRCLRAIALLLSVQKKPGGQLALRKRLCGAMGREPRCRAPIGCVWSPEAGSGVLRNEECSKGKAGRGEGLESCRSMCWSQL